MYEGEDFNTILNRMMNKIPNTVDKREGSIIYDTLAPGSVEFAKLYAALDYVFTQAYALTADREWLELHAKTFNIIPYDASKAIVQAQLEFKKEGLSVPIGTKFSYNTILFTVTRRIDENTYWLECDTPGEIGNTAEGTIIPLYNISYLSKATITGLLIPGEEVEGTEEFRKRFGEYFQDRAFGGNRADYKQKIDAMQGVGGCKLARATADDPLHVKIYIISSTFDKPSDELVQQVQNDLLPAVVGSVELTIENNGYGLAPIGHKAEVFPVEEVKLDFGVYPILNPDTNFEAIKPLMEEKINAYLLARRKEWADSDGLTVRVSGIETELLDLDGVIDILNLNIDGVRANRELEEGQIPVLGEITEIHVAADDQVQQGEYYCPDCTINYQCQVCDRAKLRKAGLL